MRSVERLNHPVCAQKEYPEAGRKQLTQLVCEKGEGTVLGAESIVSER